MRKASITNTLIGLIVFFFILGIAFPQLKQLFWLSGMDIQNKEWWRLITVSLTHQGLFHMGFNVLSLHILGTPTESLLGKRNYFLVLFISLVSGSILSVIFNNPSVASVGASGMIFGLFGSLALIGQRVGIEWRSILVIVGINFAIGFVLSGVDWRGHLGGLIGGTLVTTILNRTK